MALVELEALLMKRKKTILRLCIDTIFDTYPAETAEFLRRKADRFLNPVGHIIAEGVESLFDELIGSMDVERINASLDSIIRIRAVQEFSPSSAVSFVFLLKSAVRKELGLKGAEEIILEGRRLLNDVLEFEHRVDLVASAAFDIYVRCREQIYELRLKELKGRPR
jgi:hypothetical protein